MKCILTPSMKGEQERGEDVFPNHSTRHLSPCLFLHRRNSNLGTNLCVVVTKIEELPDWESAFLHSRGNNKSLGLLSRRAPWRVACVRRSFPLPCLSHLSSNLPPHTPSLFTPSIHLPPTYSHFVCNCSDKWSCASVLGIRGHAPCVRASVCTWAYMCVSEKGSRCLL